MLLSIADRTYIFSEKDICSVSFDKISNLSRVKHAVPEEIKAGSPIPLPFDQLEAGNLSLGLTLAPRLRQPCLW